MNPAQLFAHFHRLADAPDAVPRLRRFILDLAVRGKLVKQDPNDEASSVWLTRVGAKRHGESPFPLPPSWAWAQVGQVGDSRLGKMLDKGKNKGTPRRYLRNINVRWSEFDLTDVREMRFEDAELAEFALRRGDVLICEGGEPGRAAVWDEREKDIYFQKAIHRIRFFEGVDAHFFVSAIRESADSGRLSAYFTGVGIKHLTGRGLASFVFPLPPLAEQRRIVAKVDEVMALCDQLEAAQTERERKRDRLTAASLHRLNQPADAGDRASFRKHARFHISHLSRFTTRPDQIPALRQTILGLAVLGRLVPQDTTDEPASELLKRIHAEKAQLLMSGQLKSLKSPPAVVDGTLTSDWPQGWELQSLQSLCISVADGDHQPPPKTDRGIPFLVIGNVHCRAIDFNGCRHVNDEYFNSLDPVRRPRKGDILYTLVGSFGIPVIVSDDRPFCIQRHIGILRPSTNVSIGFLARVLESRFVFDQANACATGIAQKTVPLAGLRAFQIPLPPLREQVRIASKVEELMAVCDRLETQLTTTQAESRRLLDAILHEALDSAA